MFSKYVWDNIAQENYLRNVDLEHTDKLLLENRLFEICLVARFLTECNITKQSWLFLFNVGSRVHVWLAGRQWTGANIDWNIAKNIKFLTELFPTYEIISYIGNPGNVLFRKFNC